MDSRRFDALTKSLVTPTDRRRVLKGLGGATLGSFGLLAATRAGSAQVEPADDDDRCNRRCLRRCRRRRGDDCRDRCCDD